MVTSLRSDNILLIGFMGSGKSSVGRPLAKVLGYQFIDTDTLIESSEGRTVNEIFSTDGESYFRALERTLIDWISQHVSHAVVATGGGLPILIEDISKAGLIVYLDLTFEAIEKRMSHEESEKRPLFKDIGTAKNLYATRRPIYEARSDLRVDSDQPLENIIELITQNI